MMKVRNGVKTPNNKSSEHNVKADCDDERHKKPASAPCPLRMEQSVNRPKEKTVPEDQQGQQQSSKLS